MLLLGGRKKKNLRKCYPFWGKNILGLASVSKKSVMFVLISSITQELATVSKVYAIMDKDCTLISGMNESVAYSVPWILFVIDNCFKNSSVNSGKVSFLVVVS